MSSLDVLRIVRGALLDLGPPVYLEDNTQPRKYPTDPVELINTVPPAYHVLVSVQGAVSGGFPWVTVTHTERFGFTPDMDGHTYLSPPGDIDRTDRVAVTAWLVPALLATVKHHAVLAAAAKAADAVTPGPVEARDAIRRIG